jgi:aspartyl/asparaginyl beta-hydroxylase (cupin superfamily)
MAAFIPQLDRIWSNLLDRFGIRPLRRVSAFIDVFMGCREARPLDSRQRAFPRLYFPGLSARPWHDPDLLIPLRGVIAGIRDDCLSLARMKARFIPYEKGYGDSGASAAPEDWKAFYFHRAFREIPGNLARCPAVRTALSNLRVGREAFFSILEPGAHITPHSDGSNFLLTAHLGLIIPSRCGIKVGGEARTWQEGQWMLFDAGFIHEAWNWSSSQRAVFIVDLWHPELTAVEVSALRTLWPAFERGLGLGPPR